MRSRNEAPTVTQTHADIRHIFSKFNSLFSKHAFDIGNYVNVNHTIDLLESRPVNCGSRRIPCALEEKVSDMI